MRELLRHRRLAVTAVAVLPLLVASGVAAPSAAAAPHARPAAAGHPQGGKHRRGAVPKRQTAKHGLISPQVVHTGAAPTGYTVTFRFFDPTATTVQVRGEWFFSSPATTTTTASDGLLPTQWQPGDFPIANPNQGPAPNWPVAQMTKDPATGVWSYTTPLPSGTFTYGFYVNCTSPPPGLTGCTELSDPSNPPWNTSGSVEPDSEVYVPSDPAFGTLNLSWEAPNPRHHGRLLDVSYPDSQSTDPVGSHPLAVYLPPGYNAHRRVPYPTLYLSHGGGGNEVDWSTQGAANAIVDNLIASHKIAPMVVVMTDFNNLGTCTALDASCYATDVKDNVIPFVNSHFNVSTDPDQRAFAGLSLGGLMANYLLFNDTTLFGYYGSWSIGALGAPDATSPLWQNPDLRTRLGIQLGGGEFDSLTVPAIDSFEQTFETNGIPFSTDMVTGGHEWYTWRQLLYSFVTRVAFQHQDGTP